MKIFGITLDMKKNSDTYIPPLKAPFEPEVNQQESPPAQDRQPFSDDKTTTKSIQFNLKDEDHREAFVGLIDELHNQSVVFYLRQDGLTVLVEL